MDPAVPEAAPTPTPNTKSHTRTPSLSHLPTPLPTTSEAADPPAKPDTAPYPPTFAEIVALITSGAPIPGIRDIPNTVDPSAATKSKVAKRRKPWESEDVVLEPTEGTFGDRRDEVIVQEYPE
jgi:hypothetical protein